MTSDEQSGRPSARRFRRWLVIFLAIAAFGYLGYALVRGFSATWDALAGFTWWLLVPVLLCTLANYALRYLKWVYLLRQVEVQLPHRENLQVFIAGLAMAVSPGKAGELVKPYLVRELDDTPMARTIPVWVSERATDLFSVLILAAVGVSTYYAEGALYVLVTLGASAAGLALLTVRPLCVAVIDVVERVPLLGRVAPRLRTAYEAMRLCTAPWPLAVTMALSLLAWLAECTGAWIIYRGIGATASFGAATFLYAFSTVAGVISPGGMGITDASLAEGSLQILGNLGPGQAIAAALLIRLATLWFGVLLGGVAFLRIDGVILRYREHRP